MLCKPVELSQNDGMLIPRFTIRSLFRLITLCAAFFWFLAHAVRGQPWAAAVSIALGALIVVFVCYAVVFGLAFALAARFGSGGQSAASGSPFASDRPPPQFVPPTDPDSS